VRDGLEVIRVAAVAHAAQVVNLEPWRDVATEVRIRESVDATGVRAATEANAVDPVAALVQLSGPEPTVAALVYALPE
jgi:hypothetical protein